MDSRRRSVWLAALAWLALGGTALRAQDICSSADLCRDPDGSNAWPSNPNATLGPLQTDSFTTTEAGVIASVCFWGISWTGAQDCPPSDLFRVTYFNDDGSGTCPGTVRAGPFEVSATPTPTGSLFGSVATEYRWTLQHGDVAVESGETLWIGIANLDAACFFWWETSSDGNGSHCERRDGREDVRSGDLAFCLNVGTATDPDPDPDPTCPTQALFSEGPPRTAGLRARILNAAYLVRDTHLARTPTGRRWVSLYYRHAGAVTDLLRERPRLRRRARLLSAMLAPSLADGRGRISPHAVSLMHAVLNELSDADATGDLAAAIEDERTLLMEVVRPGQPFASVWERLDAKQAAFR